MRIRRRLSPLLFDISGDAGFEKHSNAI